MKSTIKLLVFGMLAIKLYSIQSLLADEIYATTYETSKISEASSDANESTSNAAELNQSTSELNDLDESQEGIGNSATTTASGEYVQPVEESEKRIPESEIKELDTVPDTEREQSVDPLREYSYSSKPPKYEWKEDKSFYDRFLRDRLEIGTRILAFSLDKKKSGDSATRTNTFLGSIDELEAQQDYAPIYFFLNYNIVPYWGIGISYDTITVKTLDNGGGDGDYKARGPILYTYLRYPNKTRFTPYGEIGLGFYNIGFDALPEWYEGGRRQFIVDNDIGLVLGAGLDIRVYAGWSLDLYIRHVSLDADTDYYFQDPDRLGSPQISTSVPLSHIAYGLGVKYSF